MEYETGRKDGKMIHLQSFSGEVTVGGFGNAFVTLLPASSFDWAYPSFSWIDLQTSGAYNLPVSISGAKVFVARDGSNGPFQLKAEGFTGGEVIRYSLTLEYVKK